MKHKILKFIEKQKSIENNEDFFNEGGDYLLYRILKSFWPHAEAYRDSAKHIVTKIDGRYYDITGEVKCDECDECDEYFKLENEFTCGYML